MAISKLGHNGHYGYFPLLAIMADLNMAMNIVFMGVFSKCRSAAKTVSKNMRLAKSYDQNKFIAKIMAISFVFWPNLLAHLRDP